MKYCMMGIDCDPDRNSKTLQWSGMSAIEGVLGIVPFALNVRFDPEAEKVDHIVIFKAELAGCSVGIHFHAVDMYGDLNVNFASAWLDAVSDAYKISIHDGWCNHEALDYEAAAGFKLNYSPMPGAYGPRHDWRRWPNAPVWYSGMLCLPVQTIKTRIARTHNNISTVHPTAPPILFKRLVKAFEESGNDTFCCYFHADELNGAIGGLRGWVYSKDNLLSNIRYLLDRGYIFENAETVYERFCADRSRQQSFTMVGRHDQPVLANC